MRLLFLRDGKISLIESDGSNIPDYAILSHRWGKEHEEVRYSDLLEGSRKETLGYKKIKFCMEQAIQDNLQYCWVDTCCIDRENRDERAKSIKAMFDWYRNAKKCYVFLADVTIPETVNLISYKKALEESLHCSQWFQRGWTLQELIAPKYVEFFDSKGQKFGDKTTLEREISDITHIPVEALRGQSLDSFSVDQKIKWAEHRQTSEEEDMAYCLLGIFGVIMPVMYGEGKKSAEERLLREINSISSAPFLVPYSENEQFIGRESQLAKLKAELFGQTNSLITTITGKSGMGKTSLVLALAYGVREEHMDCSVFWIQANDVQSIQQSYEYICQKLEIPGWEDQDADVKRLVQLHLSKKNAGRWLLIFDNVNDVSIWSAMEVTSDKSLINYLPESKNGHIIITSNNSDIVTATGSHTNLQIPRIDRNIAQKILESYLQKPVLESEQQHVDFLLSQLDYFPLAIVFAAAYLNANAKNTTFERYSSLLKEQETETLSFISKSIQDASQSDDSNYSLAKTWLILFKYLNDHNKLTTKYMSYMACFNNKDIPLYLLPTKQQHEKKTDALKLLASCSLVIRRPAESAIDIRQEIHSYTRNWLRKMNTQGKYTKAAIIELEQEYPEPGHWNRSKWRRLLPHAIYILNSEAISEDNIAISNFRQKCALTLYNDGRYKEAELLFAQVMETRKKKLGHDHPDTLTSMANLASTYRDQGRWDEAELLDVQVMETRKKKLGHDHPDTLTSMANLASTYWNQGRWDEAELLDVQVMETRKKKLGHDHPDTLSSMANLASTYWNQGRWDEAELLDVQVMETSKKKLGHDHPDTLTSMANLASTYRNQGRWDEAELLEVQVMETSKKKLGHDHPDTLTSMNSLAHTWKAQGKHTEALILMENCVKGMSRKLGSRHPRASIALQDYNSWKIEK